MAKIFVKESEITVLSMNESDYISLTDIAKHKSDEPYLVINHWLRNRNTIEYLGIWETLFNPDFKPVEFGRFRQESGLNGLNVSPSVKHHPCLDGGGRCVLCFFSFRIGNRGSAWLSRGRGG